MGIEEKHKEYMLETICSILYVGYEEKKYFRGLNQFIYFPLAGKTTKDDKFNLSTSFLGFNFKVNDRKIPQPCSSIPFPLFIKFKFLRSVRSLLYIFSFPGKQRNGWQKLRWQTGKRDRHNTYRQTDKQTEK